MRVLRWQPSESVDLICTDPPYGTGANTAAARLSASSAKYSSSKNPLPEIAGDSVLPDVWAEMMRDVMAQLLRVAVNGAQALIFCDWRGYPQLMRIAGASGWGTRGVIVWDKGRSARPCKNGFRAQTEFILWLRKGGARQRDHAPVFLDGVFRYPSPPRRHHLTEKPVDLLHDLLAVAQPGDHVLDPFQGSGTTGVAAIRRGLRYTGIEVVKEYHDIAVQRLQAAESMRLNSVREALYGG